MSEKQAKPSSTGKSIKLCLLILLVLLVPVVMDQVEIDPETVRTVGRVAVGITGLMFVYGMFTRLLKVFGFVVLALIGTVFLVSEGHVKAPRVREWFAARGSGK